MSFSHRFLFSGRVSHSNYRDQSVELCISENDLITTVVDELGNVRVRSIQDAYNSLSKIKYVTLVTPNNIMQKVRLTARAINEQDRFWQKKLLFLCLTLTADRSDRDKLYGGAPFQLYALDESV